jgi:pimeloyl-[acyl-carrier protein] methyl ester esterase
MGSGPDLVLLHGWGMNSAVWAAVLPRLAGNYRVWSMDLPGHGGSGYDPCTSTLSAWASACLAVAPERAAWVGWSLGGQIALQCALQEPQRVERLLLIASTPCFVQKTGWPHAMDPHTLQLFARTLQRDPRQTLSRFLSLQVKGDEAARETLRQLRRAVARRPTPDSLALQHGLRLLLTVDLREQLGHLECPLRWLLGERDSLIPAAVRGDLVSAGGVGADILPGAAHVPFLSHASQCLRWLETELERQYEPRPA